MSTSSDPSALDGWEAQRRDARVRALAATPAQRLRWLEEAIRFAAGAGALPRHGEATFLEDEREERL